MYKVFRNSKFVKSLGVYETYEAARSAVRKYLRSKYSPGRRVVVDSGAGEFSYYNPAISEYRISILKVA